MKRKSNTQPCHLAPLKESAWADHVQMNTLSVKTTELKEKEREKKVYVIKKDN